MAARVGDIFPDEIVLPVYPPGVENTAAAYHGSKALEAEFVKCFASPLRFVLLAFPWGEPGTPLEHHDGPGRRTRSVPFCGQR